MPQTLTTGDIALRLALAVAAGFLIGFNRSAHEHPAGLRTTLLVCVAAAVAMIQANILLVTTQNQEGHTLTLDLMRLPLGILTGVGFIGGGAILRQDGLVQGVTTAATLWLVTVIGLCFGGGQNGLGAAATVIGFITLWALKWAEPLMLRSRHGTLTIETSGEGPDEAAIETLVQGAGFTIDVRTILEQAEPMKSRCRLRLHYTVSREHDRPRELLEQVSSLHGVASVEWDDSNLP
ncbi:MAG: MgtC/SapB family protein [Hyphomicrobiales bacterium]|nr:MgtC/SapB family protein [Hyphomicrobiales bacterium]MBV9113371.1 MgtC/SapB family protein [Hyphomicrobiales bacterium]MBV9520148.1 MgtC/SapB family protein [Hyphomicrobiales bacterium]